MKRLKIIENYLLKNCRISNCEIKENDTDNIIARCYAIDTLNNCCRNCKSCNEIIVDTKTFNDLNKKGFLK